MVSLTQTFEYGLPLTHCGPPSCRSSPSVPGHSAPPRVVVYPPTHVLRAAEPKEFALGPRPQRPDQGRRLPPKPPTAGRRAAGVRPQSPATAPRPGSLFLSVPTHCGPPSRRCGIEVKESALSVCRALEEANWDGRPWGGTTRPLSTSRQPLRWEGCVVAYKHTKNNGFKVWPRHCCDVCCSLESGYGRSQSVPFKRGDGGSL